MELSNRKFIEIADRFSSFTFSFLQGYVQMTEMMDKHGITKEEIASYVQENRDLMNSGVNFAKEYMDGGMKFKTCPMCGGKMTLEGVNTCKGNQIPGGWKCVFTCSRHIECGHQIFSKNSTGVEQYKHFKKTGAFDKFRPKRGRTHNGPELNVEEQIKLIK